MHLQARHKPQLRANGGPAFAIAEGETCTSPELRCLSMSVFQLFSFFSFPAQQRPGGGRCNSHTQLSNCKKDIFAAHVMLLSAL